MPLPGWHHCPLPALYLRERRLDLRQPEGHVHRPVQVESSREFGAGLVRPAYLGIQGAEPTVAVRLERAHLQFLGQRQGLPVVGFSRLDIRGVAVHGDVAEEPEGIRLVSTLLGIPREIEGTLSIFERIPRAAGQQIRLAQTSEMVAPSSL